MSLPMSTVSEGHVPTDLSNAAKPDDHITPPSLDPKVERKHPLDSLTPEEVCS